MSQPVVDNRTLDGAAGVAFLHRYSLALDKLRSWGVSVPGGSRLLEYERLFRRWATVETTKMVDAIAPSEVHAVHEAQDVIEIVEGFQSIPAEEEIERLRWLPSDSYEPRFSGNSEARDYQFELVLTSWLRRSGVSCEMSTPDIVVNCFGEPLGIEAKRPKSAKRVLKAAKDARRALERKKMVGFLAMSLDLMVRPQEGMFVTTDRSQSQALLLSRVKEWRSEHLEGIRRICANGQFLVGLVLIATIPVLEGNALAWAGTTQRGSNPEHDHRATWLINHLRPHDDFATIL